MRVWNWTCGRHYWFFSQILRCQLADTPDLWLTSPAWGEHGWYSSPFPPQIWKHMQIQAAQLHHMHKKLDTTSKAARLQERNREDSAFTLVRILATHFKRSSLRSAGGLLSSQWNYTNTHFNLNHQNGGLFITKAYLLLQARKKALSKKKKRVCLTHYCDLCPHDHAAVITCLLFLRSKYYT